MTVFGRRHISKKVIEGGKAIVFSFSLERRLENQVFGSYAMGFGYAALSSTLFLLSLKDSEAEASEAIASCEHQTLIDRPVRRLKLEVL